MIPSQADHRYHGRGDRPSIPQAKQRRLQPATDPKLKEEQEQKWIRKIRQLYQALHHGPYLKPPVYFNRVSHKRELFCSNEIKVLIPSEQMSDVREDEAMQRIHNAFSGLCDRFPDEVMFVVFNLDFDNYLNLSVQRSGEPNREARKKKLCQQNCQGLNEQRTFLSPQQTDDTFDMSSKSTDFSDVDLSLYARPRDLQSALQRGKFDILIIHRQHGFLIFEVKILGDAFCLSEQVLSASAQHDVIRKKIRTSLKQLEKEEKVLRYLVADIVSGLTFPVTKGLMLPNLKRETVRQALVQDPGLVQSLCCGFGSDTLEDALRRCIFSDQLPPFGHTLDSDSVQNILCEWWQGLDRHISFNGFTDDVYESIIARFCGPATTQYVITSRAARAELSTLKQAVLETSHCFTETVLMNAQVNILKQHHSRMYITGLPGTGKTLMLLLKAIEWLNQGRTVVITSLWEGSEAVSRLTYEKLKRELSTSISSRLHFVSNSNPNSVCEDILKVIQISKSKHYDITDAPADETRKKMEEYLSSELIYLLIDEASWFLHHFVNKLESLVGKDRVVIWAAASFPGRRLKGFHEVVLTHSLRCPPVVIREMKDSPAYSTFAWHEYTSQDTAMLASMHFPTDGPPVKRILHGQHGKQSDVLDCEMCGQAVAKFLTEDLQIGKRAEILNTLKRERQYRRKVQLMKDSNKTIVNNKIS